MPPQQQIQLQWKGPPVPRAKPLPPELWEAHREELSDLYQRMTLEDLMAVMKVRHGFTPNRRQYVFQFEKWGLNKYNTNVTKMEIPAKGEQQTVHFKQAISNEGKRLYSATSNTSRTSIGSSHFPNRPYSSREKPPIPAKKRQKLVEYMASRDPYANLGLAFDTPPVLGLISPCILGETQTSHIPEGLPIDFSDESANGLIQNTMSGSKDWTTSTETSDCSILSRHSASEICLDSVDFEPWASQRPLGQIPQQERHIDMNRHIDTFSSDEIEDMKRAADFLFGLGSEADACSLYILVLKRLKDSQYQPHWATTSAIIQCAKSACTASQKEIVRSLLQRCLIEEANDSKKDAERFLFRMLLAETYSRECDWTQACFHANLAMVADLANEQLITHLSDDYRILDILTYHFLIGGLHTYLKSKIPKTSALTPHYINQEKLCNELLKRKPGPFEFINGVMQNPCLKSCLRWCLCELRQDQSLSFTRELTKANKENALYAKVTRLYCYLWEQSQSCQTRYEGTNCILWINQTERMMGIPAAEVLWTLCAMFACHDRSQKDRLGVKLIRQAYLAAEYFHAQADVKLAEEFLSYFCLTNSLNTSAQKQLAFRGVIQAYAKEFVERKLWMRLPEVVPETFKQIANSGSPRQSLEIVAAAFLPTLASTLHSSELASLKTIRDRMQANVKDAMQGVVAATQLPSSGMRMSMKSTQSNLSIPSISMSELSMAMARTSLSMSSSSLKLKENAESVMDTLANASNRARNKLNGSRTSDNRVDLLELDSDDDLKAD